MKYHLDRLVEVTLNLHGPLSPRGLEKRITERGFDGDAVREAIARLEVAGKIKVDDSLRFVTVQSLELTLVIIESPFAGDIERNERYLSACLADSLSRGEAPFASHGLYTRPGVLDDLQPVERERGILAGFSWRRAASITAVYSDLGISGGMQRGIDDASTLIGHVVDFRTIPGWE